MDEHHTPIAFSDGEPVTDGDVLWCLNFRADRGREMSQMFSDADFDGFPRTKLDIFYLATFKYYPTFTGHFLLGELDIHDTLPEVLAKNNKTQLHTSETDKFIHVTKFFAGLHSEPYPGQTNEIFASYKDGLFSEKPDMEAEKICQYLLENAANYDFTVVNFPNGDLVGHCGRLDASVAAVRKLGDVVQKLIDWSRDRDFTLIITADHGNCERMGTSDHPDTAHTKNPVPCWIIR
jgi:2,3-bisphosphoglycerate-independent phosphoglycerate mutase